MSLKRVYTVTGLVIAVIALVIILFTSWYTVDESDQAVILTFGKAEETVTDPGLHFKLPWPVQSVEKLARETLKLEFGIKEDGKSTSETKMITGDENIVLADLVVQWRITDPKNTYSIQKIQRVFYIMLHQHH